MNAFLLDSRFGLILYCFYLKASLSGKTKPILLEDGALLYEEYFGLSKKPFSIVPDPRHVFLSAGHSEALAHLLYGIKSDGGFVLLTGDIGTGKTTACRLLELLPSDLERGASEREGIRDQ